MTRFLVLTLLLLWMPASGVVLTWDASQYATGYRLYYGTNSGVYPFIVDVGTNLTVRIFGLLPGSTNYFAITAYNSTAESTHSGEVPYFEPLVITNTLLTIDYSPKITGPWTNVVSLTNVMEAAGFWRINFTTSTN